MTDSQAVFYRPDLETQGDLRVDASANLHRQAGIRGYSTTPRSSNITQGQTYYAEVMQHSWPGRPPESGLVRYNVAMGTGKTSLLACLDGFLKIIPIAGDPVWALTVMEVELELLKRAVAAARAKERSMARLEEILDTLTEMVAKVNEGQ